MNLKIICTRGVYLATNNQFNSKMTAAIRQTPIVCSGHTRPVVDLKFGGETDCGPLLLAASKDGRAVLRTGDTGDWIGTFASHRGAVWCCTMDKAGRRAATGAADFTAKLWDVTTGLEILSIAQDHIVRALDLSLADGGQRLMMANNKQQVHVYDLASPNSPVISLPNHKKTIRRCLWTDDDRRALTITDDKTMALWDMSAGCVDDASRLIWSATLDDCPIDAQILCQSEGVRAVVAEGRFVCTYKLDFRSSNPPKPATKFELPCQMYTAHLHPSGNQIVAGGEDNLLYRLDASTGEILETCRGHFGPVHCARFSPDGELFASGSEDGTVRLWQTEVGKTYGLWKLGEMAPDALFSSSSSPPSQQPLMPVL